MYFICIYAIIHINTYLQSACANNKMLKHSARFIAYTESKKSIFANKVQLQHNSNNVLVYVVIYNCKLA